MCYNLNNRRWIFMKLEKFTEKDNKRIGIIVFTIVCILLVSGVILYRTFAIFEVKTNQNVINGQVQDIGDLEFAFYVDGKIDKNVPAKDTGYTLNTEKSKCIDMTTGNIIKTGEIELSWYEYNISEELLNGFHISPESLRGCSVGITKDGKPI